ncbi:MAG TPA: hypothetical protein VJA87_02120 [Candidatus Paceibacterota bacterium]
MQFLAIYKTPQRIIEEWMKTDSEVQKQQMEKMQQEWDTWLEEHKASIVGETAAAGKTKLVNANGTSDAKNDIMMYSIVEAESPEEAAKIFESHPHFQIPESTIEVMKSTPVSEMQVN